MLLNEAALASLVLLLIALMDATAGLPDYYMPDGTLNNPLYPHRGNAITQSIREHPKLHSYISNIDGPEAPVTPVWHHPRLDLPSPRKIIVELFQNSKPRPNERASQLLMTFGHFVARDITRSAVNGTLPMPIECDLVETRGPFCPMGESIMKFHRSARDMSADGNINSTGEPLNFATAWLDMDHVYGQALPGSPEYLRYREGTGGRMKLEKGLPPIHPETGLYSVYDDTMRRLPGDLALMATFLHYHNTRAKYHQEQHPEWNDETLFIKARMDVLAVYQATFEEKYVPAVLGEPLSNYEGYDANVDSSIDVFFSTSSFRYGHSGMSGWIRLVDKDWNPLPQDPMLLRDVFNQTESIIKLLGGDGRGTIAAILRGLAFDATRAPDANFVDDMTLFTEAAVVKNIQRGRDNGLPSYNDAREWFDMDRVESYLELSQGDEAAAKRLEGLYGKGNVDDVDVYVGAMLENPISKHHEIGPLNEASMREQFERLRNGDRLWYRERLTPEQIQQLPTLPDLIRDACPEMIHFPDDLFAIVSSGTRISGSGSVLGDVGTIEVFDGDLTVQWKSDKEHIDFILSTVEKMTGGYIGLGWGSNSMKGAEIWFCQLNTSNIHSRASCDAAVGFPAPNQPLDDPGPFSCCVAPGKRHVRPICGDHHNYLTVLDSCASNEDSYVTVRAKLCSSQEESNCFSHEGDIDFIAAYNPFDVNAAHGFSRRTGGTTNLALGVAATCSDDSAQAGLFALHGVTLLFAWLVLAPIAIYVVRYCKDKPWRLRVHITLVGIIGGLMIALVVAVIVSVEGTSFGTVDAESAQASGHKKAGLSIVVFVMFMIVTGELRRERKLSKRTKSLLVERAVIISHRIGGLTLVGLAWYNCYTGLVQISPYVSDSVEVTFFSSKIVNTGYDLEFFGFLQKYIYFPWIAIVLLVFAVTEIRVRLAHGRHTKKIKAAIRDGGSIVNLANETDLPGTTVENFLFMLRQGSSLSIIDGYVIDISRFMEVHPGGTNVLQFAVGCDITSYFIGEMHVGGISHKHSQQALTALQPLVKWKLEGNDPTRRTSQTRNRLTRSVLGNGRTSILGNRNRGGGIPASFLSGLVFRNGTVVGHEILSTNGTTDEKYTIRLSISLEKEECIDNLIGTALPTSTFIFRHVDFQGNVVERPYTAYQCNLSKPIALVKQSITLPLHRRIQTAKAETVVYDFFISLVPGGRMSGILAKSKVGKPLMVKGPMASVPFMQKLAQQECTGVCLITQGTGVTPCLQLIDYYLRTPYSPKVTLLWLVNERNSSFEGALDLDSRKCDNFRYAIISEKETLHGIAQPAETSLDDTSKECKARQAFLELCREQDIFHQETVASLLNWSRLMNNGEDAEEDGKVARSDMELEDRYGEEELASCSEDDSSLTVLVNVGESLRTGLEYKDHGSSQNECFSGYDVVSFLVEEGYTPSRASALTLGRELDSKLNLFHHVNDVAKLLLDDENEIYSFVHPDECGWHRGTFSRTVGTRNLGTQGLVIGLCGHTSFEAKMIESLKSAGVDDGHIFRFPEGSVSLSEFSAFMPMPDRAGTCRRDSFADDDGCR